MSLSQIFVTYSIMLKIMLLYISMLVVCIEYFIIFSCLNFVPSVAIWCVLFIYAINYYSHLINIDVESIRKSVLSYFLFSFFYFSNTKNNNLYVSLSSSFLSSHISSITLFIITFKHQLCIFITLLSKNGF